MKKESKLNNLGESLLSKFENLHKDQKNHDIWNRDFLELYNRTLATYCNALEMDKQSLPKGIGLLIHLMCEEITNLRHLIKTPQNIHYHDSHEMSPIPPRPSTGMSGS
jgi:hypothetical protein